MDKTILSVKAGATETILIRQRAKRPSEITFLTKAVLKSRTAFSYTVDSAEVSNSKPFQASKLFSSAKKLATSITSASGSWVLRGFDFGGDGFGGGGFMGMLSRAAGGFSLPNNSLSMSIAASE